MTTSEQPTNEIFHVLASLAWADGSIAPAERALLEDLLQTHILDDEERTQLTRWLDEAPPTISVAHYSAVPEVASTIMLQGLRLMMIDHVFSICEQAMMERLREQLNISPRDYAQLQMHVERELAESGKLG
jgi:uncharacterized membrane protein YebE (DUF533 family)